MRDLWFERDGTRLYAVEDGEGPPLVMMHGGLADHRAIWRSVSGLADRCRVICPDVRGNGRSHWAGPLDWRRLSEDLAALLDAIGATRAVVGGVSGGSGVAIRFALDHPGRVAGLILGLPHFPGGDIGQTDHQRSELAALSDLARRAPLEGMQVMSPAYAGLPEGAREGALAMMASFDPASFAATAAFLASGVQPMASAAELSRLTMPVLIQPGNDPMHPAEVSASYARAVPHAVVGDSIRDFCERLGDWRIRPGPGRADGPSRSG